MTSFGEIRFRWRYYLSMELIHLLPIFLPNF